MFAVLKLLPREKGLRARIRERFEKSEPTVTQIPVKSGAPFFSVEMRIGRDGADWTALAAMLGRCAKRLLIEDGIVLPESGIVKRFVPERLPSILLFNSAVQLMENSGLPPVNCSCTLIDKTGIFCSALHKLIPLAASVRVVTDQIESYEAAAEQIFEAFGASVVICEEEPTALRDTFVLRPFAASGAGTVTVTDKDERHSILHGEGIVLPQEYADLLPQNTDPLVFASALYELCGVRVLSSLTYTHLKR